MTQPRTDPIPSYGPDGRLSYAFARCTLGPIVAGALVFAAGTAMAMPYGQVASPEPITQNIVCLSVGGVSLCQGGDNMIQKTKSKKVSKNKHNSGGGSNWNYQKTPQDDWDYDGVHETIKADRNQGAGSRAEAGKSVGIGTPESACPPGQTNKLKKYAGTCMPIELGNMRESTNPKEKTSACPPGQSDKLRKYVGICMPISAARD